MPTSDNTLDANHGSKHGKGFYVTAICLIICVATPIIYAIYTWREQSIAAATVDCHDPEGRRPKIDIRQFETQYSGYSVSLQAEIAGKGKMAATMEPHVLQTLSESIQMAMEFHKAIVAGYDSCGVSRHAYDNSVRQYQALDGIARQIQILENKPAIGKSEEQEIRQLVYGYSIIARSLANPGK